MMKYEEWSKLTDEQQEQVPDEDLPEVPTGMLRNGLTMAKAMRQNGELGWNVTQMVGGKAKTLFLPKWKSREQNGLMLWWRLDELAGTYLPYEETEPSLEQEPLGVYGLKWKHWMEDNYPELVEWMCYRGIFLTTARSQEIAADEYYDLLEAQFDRENPRPRDFNETVAWEQTKAAELDSAVMRDVLLTPVTAPSQKYLHSLPEAQMQKYSLFLKAQ